MCLLYSVFPGIYVIIAAGVADAFGPDHYQSNFGLLFSQSIAYCATVIILTKVGKLESCIDPYILTMPIEITIQTPFSYFIHVQVPVIHAALGYTGMFLVAGGCGVMGLLVVAWVPTQFRSVR